MLPVPAGSAAGGVLFIVVVLLGALLATAMWVYADARTSAKRGRPVVSTVGRYQLRTPASWFVACLLLWELCIPLYLDTRGAA
ncbi:MAG: hypothetical protein K0R68_1888 [Mycobacterium sp.]|jgi:hypothetical protein|nr:hypothetical protein [Mycobacterium sp.]